MSAEHLHEAAGGDGGEGDQAPASNGGKLHLTPCCGAVLILTKFRS